LQGLTRADALAALLLAAQDFSNVDDALMSPTADRLNTSYVALHIPLQGLTRADALAALLLAADDGCVDGYVEDALMSPTAVDRLHIRFVALHTRCSVSRVQLPWLRFCWLLQMAATSTMR
jgi:hypothetical protein